MPGRRSTSCIRSIVAFLCGTVCLATCRTGWVNSFWLSFGSVTVFVIVVRIVDVAIRVRGIGVTVFVSRTVLIIFSFLISLFFQQSTLISVLSWFLQWWHVGLGLSAFVFAVLWLTVFICSSSGACKPFSSNCFSRCVTICSILPFSKWAWFIDFFGCGGILAYMSCSMMAWAAIPNASSASFWSSPRKSTNTTSFWNLCFAVAFDWGFTYFLRKTARISPSFSRVGPLMFLNVYNASPFMREWK